MTSQVQNPMVNPVVNQAQTPENSNKLTTKNCITYFIYTNQTTIILVTTIVLILMLLFAGSTAVIILLLLIIFVLEYDTIMKLFDKLSNNFSSN